MSARKTLLFAALLALPACSFDFARSTDVTDRRILAIQVEPPELAGGAALPAFVQARALVVDPSAPDAVTEIHWWSCMVVDLASGAGDSRCPEGEATVLLASGEAPLSAVSQTVPLPPEVVGVLASGRDVPAPQVQVQLKVGSGEGELFAIKEVAVTPLLPEGQEANRNPVLQRLMLNGEEWLPDVPRVLRYGECPDEERKEVEAEDGSRVRVCEHDIEPIFDEAEAQFYEERGLSGEPETQRERLRFNWFSDAGSFRRGRTDQKDPRDPSPDNIGPKAEWREPPTKNAGATIWVVIRDGRGGIHWERREVRFE
ncbi:hypothetical protein [Hyalangium rubrum]|uniref:Lipoprotein n=1 Tax=Hyalangium rubrum TaxID=3103134 RepID=A0ABU5GZE6_9BACT|nr:hypothetical protein [Hyalangium sp. s54d21]MDY7226254.1 hypothetical protein [Hyalangium sp. s54d21]